MNFKQKHYAALRHNQNAYKSQCATGIWCLKDYFFYDKSRNLIVPGLSNHFLYRKLDDIIASTVVGAIPFDTKSGADALKYSQGVFKEIEVKLAVQDGRDFLENQNGTIVYGTSSGGPVKYFCSAFKSSFKIVKNTSSKNRDTYQVLMESSKNELIDVYMIPGDHIVKILGLYTSQDRKIRLPHFANPETGIANKRNQSRKVKTNFDAMGLKGFVDRVKNNFYHK